MSGDDRTRFGPYEILGRLGEGAMGVVDLAEDTRLGRRVALKRLKEAELGSGTGETGTARARFEEEIRAASRLDHAGIAKVYEVGSIDGQPYYTMELLVGRPLDAVLAEERLGPIASARIALELARALDHAHREGVVHRDVKPSNVLVDEEYNPRLVDFGLAKRLTESAGLTRTGSVVGTPQFLAPEQLETEFGAVGPRTDVYGVGGVLFACLTGQPPNAGANEVEIFYRLVTEPAPSPRRIDPAIPPRLSSICRRALDRRPDRRYASAADLGSDLETFLGGLSRGGRDRAWREPRRIVASSIAVALVLGSLLWAGLTGSDDARRRHEGEVERWRAELAGGFSTGDGRRAWEAATALEAIGEAGADDVERVRQLFRSERVARGESLLEEARAALEALDPHRAAELARVAREIDPSLAAAADDLRAQVEAAGSRWSIDGRATTEAALRSDPGRVEYAGWFYRRSEVGGFGLLDDGGRVVPWPEVLLLGKGGTDATLETLPAPRRFRLDGDRAEWVE